MGSTFRLVPMLALALVFVAPAEPQDTPVTLQRLNEALNSKLLDDKEIAEIVLELGVSFRMTPELEKDFRRRGASDLVILAVRNGFRPPLAAGPASVEAIVQALERGSTNVDVVAHLEKDGVSGPFNADLRKRLATAGASPVLQTIIASRWLEANSLDGSLDQVEALLAAGASSEQLAPKVREASLTFTANRESFSRLSSAGAGPVLLNAVAATSLANAQEPLVLEHIVVIQGAGVDPSALAKKVSEVGTNFEAAEGAAEQMRAAGVDAVVTEAVLTRKVAAGNEPFSIEALARVAKSGVAIPAILASIRRRGVDFTLTNEAAVSLVALPKAIRVAAVIQSLNQQGYRSYRPPRATVALDPAQGQFDIRLTIDNIEEVVAIEDVILVKSSRGAPSVDEGSEVFQPLPIDLDPNTFAVEVKDGRGEVSPYWKPERANGFIFRARLTDEKSGPDRYHMRLTWRRGGANAGGIRREAPTLKKN